MTPIYEIRIEGHLDTQWADWFDGISITREADGKTLLSGPVPDQPALYGLLHKVRDLGIPLVSVNLQSDAADQQNSYKFKKGAIKMVTNEKTSKLDKRVLLSTLWIVIMINLLKADILSLFIPGSAEELARTSVSTGTPIPQLMLFGAIMGEIGIVMIILSRILKRGANRWVNIIVSLLYIAYIVGGGVLYPHYIFIATVEVFCLLLILWNAWKWSGSEE